MAIEPLEMEMTSPIFLVRGAGIDAAEVIRENPHRFSCRDPSLLSAVQQDARRPLSEMKRERRVQLGRFTRNVTWVELGLFLGKLPLARRPPHGMRPAQYLDVLSLALWCPERIEKEGLIVAAHTLINHRGSLVYPGIDNGDRAPDTQGRRHHFETCTMPVNHSWWVPNTWHFAMYVHGT